MQVLQKDGHFMAKVVANKSELLRNLNHENTFLLIVDYALFDFESYADLTQIKKKFSKVQILVLTNSISKAELLELNAAGIKNIIYKTIDEEELFEAINATLKKKKYYSAELLDMLFEINEKKNSIEETVQLTNTETEIVRLVAEGLTTKDIAARKNISFHTVITHRKNIFKKLGVSSASELIMYAIKAGWIDNIEYFI
jgi:DNA-binding NarL/FixJ family response regulator